MSGDAMTDMKRRTLNFGFLAAGELVSKGFAVVGFAHLARVLGPAGFGQLEFAIAVVFFLALVVDSGLGVYGTREVARDETALPRLLAHIVTLRSLLALACFSLLVIGTGLAGVPDPVRNLIRLYGLTLFGLPGVLSWVFQGRDLMGWVGVASMVRWLVFAGGVLLWIRHPAQIATVPLIEVGVVAAVAVFYLAGFLYRFGAVRHRIDRAVALSMLRDAAPIGASEVVWALKMYSATVLLGMLADAAEVGWFAAAHRIVVSLHTFVWLYFVSLLPSIARCNGQPIGALNALLRPSIRLAAWAGVCLGAVGGVLAGPTTALLYGPRYEGAAGVLRVLVWFLPLALMSGHYRYSLVAFDQQRREFLSALGGAGVNLLLSALLIPRYGAAGAAWALVTSEAVIWGLAYRLVRSAITRIPAWPEACGLLAAAAGVAGGLYVLPVADGWLIATVVTAALIVMLRQVQMVAFGRGIWWREP